MNYGLHLSLKMEKHLEALLAQQQQLQGRETNRISTSTNAHSSGEHNGTNNDHETGIVPPHYGIQYQNRDGDESVVWGNGAGAGAMEVATGLLGIEDLEEKALGMAIEEVWEESGRKWRPWAANGRATRIGEIVLIVDSDTVVPEDCLRDAAREMRACPTVAIIQHESGGFFLPFFVLAKECSLFWCRCDAGRASLFRKRHRVFHEKNQQVYLDM